MAATRFDLRAPDGDFRLERAGIDDVGAIVRLLREDVREGHHETQDLAPYVAAFGRIDDDPSRLLVVVRDGAGHIVGTMHLTLVPRLSRTATTRLQIEGVRVAARLHGSGLGSALLEWAERYGRQHGAGLVQLTTETRRREELRAYEQLGYISTHEGLKKVL